MKTLATMALAALGLVLGSALAQDEKPKSAPDLKDNRSKASYAIGLSTGRNFKAQSIDIDVEALAKGMADALAGSKPSLTEEECQAAVKAFEKDLRAKQLAKMPPRRSEPEKVVSAENKKAGDAYLAKNKIKPGVKTTSSGLQYEVLKAGNRRVAQGDRHGQSQLQREL